MSLQRYDEDNTQRLIDMFLHYIEIVFLCDVAPPTVIKKQSNVCSNLSGVTKELTTNKPHYIITMLGVENLYVEVNACDAVIRPPH